MSQRSNDRRDTATPPPQTRPHSFGFRQGVDLDKLGQLADELESEAFAGNINESARPGRRRSRTKPLMLLRDVSLTRAYQGVGGLVVAGADDGVTLLAAPLS